MTQTPVALPLTISEAAFQRAVIDYALWRKWRCAHFRPARTTRGWATPIEGHAGFPDLVLARDGVVLIRELKRHGSTARLTADQRLWITALGWIAGVWTPADWAEIVEVLR